MSSEHAVYKFPAAVPKSQQTALPPKWKAIRVGREDYRVVPDGKATSGHLWLRQFGTNAMGEPDWRECQAPSRTDLEAALYAAS